MQEINLNLDDRGRGAFVITVDQKQLGEMSVTISGSRLIVYHTEVSAEATGKGLAKDLLNFMVDYVRSHALKVVPFCPYVHAQFKRYAPMFDDIWLKDTEEL